MKTIFLGDLFCENLLVPGDTEEHNIYVNFHNDTKRAVLIHIFVSPFLIDIITECCFQELFHLGAATHHGVNRGKDVIS